MGLLVAMSIDLWLACQKQTVHHPKKHTVYLLELDLYVLNVLKSRSNRLTEYAAKLNTQTLWGNRGVVRNKFFYRTPRIQCWNTQQLFVIHYTYILYTWRRRVIGISGSLIWLKTLMELIFNPCGEFPWSSEGPVSQIRSPHLLVGAPGIFSDLLMSVQMLKRELGAESNGKLPHLFIPSKTATLVPTFAEKDLPSGRTF